MRFIDYLQNNFEKEKGNEYDTYYLNYNTNIGFGNMKTNFISFHNIDSVKVFGNGLVMLYSENFKIGQFYNFHREDWEVL